MTVSCGGGCWNYSHQAKACTVWVGKLSNVLNTKVYRLGNAFTFNSVTPNCLMTDDFCKLNILGNVLYSESEMRRKI